MVDTLRSNTTLSPGVSGGAASPLSAVAWPAILGGTFTAAVVSLALLILGSGLGFAAISPWSPDENTLTEFSIKTAIWLIIMQWVAAAFGGYVTGRLRTRWVGTDPDEIFFRDTAHGFLTWATATLFTAAFLTSTFTAVVGGSAKMVADTATGVAATAADSQNGGGAAGQDQSLAYYVDSLFRSSPDTSLTALPFSLTPSGDPEMRAEVLRILTTVMTDEGLSETDRSYLAQLIAARTGLSQDEAQARVDDIVTQLTTLKARAVETAEKAQTVAASFSIFTFLSMLVGAFIACITAALGGKHRDQF